jgi:hypothetical protein
MSAIVVKFPAGPALVVDPADTMLAVIAGLDSEERKKARAALRARLATIEDERKRITIENAVILQAIRELEKET